MSRRDEPQHIGDSLSSLAKRIRRVDLVRLEDVRRVWPEIVDPSLATRCVPVLIKGETLVVDVPSGLYAQRLREDSELIVSQLHARGFPGVADISPQVIRSNTT